MFLESLDVLRQDNANTIENNKTLVTAGNVIVYKLLKTKNNGVKRSRLFVLRHTRMPAALVEPGFITNQKDFNKINWKTQSRFYSDDKIQFKYTCEENCFYGLYKFNNY